MLRLITTVAEQNVLPYVEKAAAEAAHWSPGQ
jgi:hypothetical protein